MSIDQTNSQDKLQKIVEGDLVGIKKPKPTIYVGPRVKNIIWKNLIIKFQNEGLDFKEILEKVIEFDKLVEDGELTQDLIDKYS